MISAVSAIVNSRRPELVGGPDRKPSVGAAARSTGRAARTSKSGSGAPVNGARSRSASRSSTAPGRPPPGTGAPLPLRSLAHPRPLPQLGEERAIARSSPAPPEIPSQSILIIPTSR